ncbi:MAG: DUF2130 domain-containing protein [Cyclobacteriaceae bacterium]
MPLWFLRKTKEIKYTCFHGFLTSNTFRLQIEAIMEGFTAMKNGLESEKRAMQRIWKERDKQIDKVFTNTVDMYGSIKGIAGNAVQFVKALELGGVDEDSSRKKIKN